MARTKLHLFSVKYKYKEGHADKNLINGKIKSDLYIIYSWDFGTFCLNNGDETIVIQIYDFNVYDNIK